MENEMIERVALALRKQEWGDSPDPHWHGEVRALWIGFARAAIKAMREPSEAMLRACPVVGTGPNEQGKWATSTKPAEAMWPAMIDAALAPTKQPA